MPSMMSLVFSGRYLANKPCVTAAWFRFVNCLTGFGFPGCPFGYRCFFWVASFLLFRDASFFEVASLDHFSRLLLLFKVPILTSYFSAKSLKDILVDSHSLCITYLFTILEIFSCCFIQKNNPLSGIPYGSLINKSLNFIHTILILSIVGTPLLLGIEKGSQIRCCTPKVRVKN